MFALKVLSGKLIGKTFTLGSNETVIGRSPKCDITLPNENISKQHAKIIFEKNKIVLADLNSTNGSFVNGIKVEVTTLKSGDKISIYDTILEVQNDTSAQVIPFNSKYSSNYQDTTLDESESVSVSEPHFASGFDKILWKIDRYIENAAMTPVYKLSEVIEFKWLTGLFCLGLVLMTVALSTIPLMNIINDSIELESKRRASSLAKTLAALNTEALADSNFSGTTVSYAAQEPGVSAAYIIRQSDGSIIAPGRLSGQFIGEKFAHTARKRTDKPFHVAKVENNRIIAMHPIKFYSPGTGLADTTRFYSVVVYNSKILATNDNRTLSLFIQTLILALIFGGVLFLLFYKLVEYPVKSLNKDLESALRSNDNLLSTKILLPSVQQAYSNLNSALNRTSSGGGGSVGAVEADRTMEMQNISQLIGYASLVISAESEAISDYNDGFEELTNLVGVAGTPLSALSDQALQQNLLDLVERCKTLPDQVHSNEFEFSGIPYEIRMHTVSGTSGIAYFVTAFIPMEAE